MKKTIIIFAVFMIAALLFCGVVSASDGTSEKKLVNSSPPKNIAAAKSSTTIIDQGVYRWTDSKGHKCYYTWKDYKISARNVVVKYTYKHQNKYYTGQMTLVNKVSQNYNYDVYATGTGNMWKNQWKGFIGTNEYASSYAARKTGLYQVHRKGSLISYFVHPAGSVTPPPSNIPPTLTLLEGTGEHPYGCPYIFTAKIIDSQTIYLTGRSTLPYRAGPGFSPNNVIIKSNTGTRIYVKSLSLPTKYYVQVKLSTPMKNGFKYTMHIPTTEHYFVDHFDYKSPYVTLAHHKI